MDVWIVECGCYNERYIGGVYATLEAAIADNPPRRVIPEGTQPTSGDCSRPGGWQPSQTNGAYMRERYPDGDWDDATMYDDPDEWTNALDWEDAARCFRIPVQNSTTPPAP